MDASLIESCSEFPLPTTDSQPLRPVVSQASTLQPLPFEMSQISGFRYRAEGVLAKLKPAAVREARLEGLRKEILNSQKLKEHFAAK